MFEVCTLQCITNPLWNGVEGNCKGSFHASTHFFFMYLQSNYNIKAIKVPSRKIPMSGWGRPAEETAKQTKTMSKPIQSALLTNEGFQRCIQRYNTVKAVGTAEVAEMPPLKQWWFTNSVYSAWRLSYWCKVTAL